ncbi:hypothetical protein HY68_33935 [Streptomyces sp. AcH 505]|nr:hypothetical protein HY68_33935 [Streptomyces sp. AcH 505]
MHEPPQAGHLEEAQRRTDSHRPRGRGDEEIGTDMIVLGVILLLIGLLVGVSLLTTIGGVLVVVGAALWILGASGRAVGGRKHYF